MQGRQTGPTGERAVVQWLTDRGYEVLAQNARVGRNEIDIVARRGDTIVFCEVKSAAQSSVVDPVERLSPAQQRRVRQASSGWLREHPQRGIRQIRLDAAFVRLPQHGDGVAEIRYYEGAF